MRTQKTQEMTSKGSVRHQRHIKTEVGHGRGDCIYGIPRGVRKSASVFTLLVNSEDEETGYDIDETTAELPATAPFTSRVGLFKSCGILRLEVYLPSR